MMVVGMLFVLLVLGPVIILGVMALASNERAMARWRRLPRRQAADEVAADGTIGKPDDHATPAADGGAVAQSGEAEAS